MGLSTDGANVNELIHFGMRGGVDVSFPSLWAFVSKIRIASQPAAAQTGPDQQHYFAFQSFISLFILFCSMKGR